MYEATGATQNIKLSTVGGSDAERWLFSDFDNGITANDAFGFHFDKPNLGFGPDEVYASSGDSGAPIFVNNGYSHVIAGTVSGGARFSGTPNADVDDTVTSSNTTVLSNLTSNQPVPTLPQFDNSSATIESTSTTAHQNKDKLSVGVK